MNIVYEGVQIKVGFTVTPELALRYWQQREIWYFALQIIIGTELSGWKRVHVESMFRWDEVFLDIELYVLHGLGHDTPEIHLGRLASAALREHGSMKIFHRAEAIIAMITFAGQSIEADLTAFRECFRILPPKS
jgi:hypothetical protein